MGPLVLDSTGPAGDALLTQLLMLVSHLGGQGFYIFVVPLVYWCYKKDFGIGMAIMLLSTYYINLAAKEFFKVPRPTPKGDIPEGVNTISYSFPSGHAQGGVSFWVFIIVHVRRYWAVMVGIVWVLVISYSRLHLGVHRWEDIIAGWALGAVIALVFVLVGGKAVGHIERMDHFQRLSLAIAVPTIMFILFKTVMMAQLCGFLLGVMAGAEIERTSLGMSDCGTHRQRAIRMVLGFPLCGILLFGFGGLMTDVPGFQFLAYTVSGMGVTYLAPLLFSVVER